ncbi:hypothetical protein [Paeniglutamicibacter sp. Y32M11]|uniref:hypothetical protein n=1 Tax=Paeniglutamicibacter sp. Y32M11 TaxID=2853258 RepID=UPI001C527E75|nr:hypothetical protein [Paeniglutamicibacter sp. Y32M11]QXQ11418.1 hypothetical protein KUF55_05865 [Paeniglutamicibacter sp. Y32M11]
MKTFTNKIALIPITAGLALALAGCNGASQAPDQSSISTTTTGSGDAAAEAPTIVAPEASDIFPRALEAMQSASSAALIGDLTRGSETMNLKLSGTRDGSNTLAEVTTEGATVQILNVGGTGYLKADKSFFSQQAGEDAAKMIDLVAGDKWISVSDTSQFGDFSVGSLIDSFGEDGLQEADLAKIEPGALEDVNGVKAFKYSDDETDMWFAA